MLNVKRIWICAENMNTTSAVALDARRGPGQVPLRMPSAGVLIYCASEEPG